MDNKSKEPFQPYSAKWLRSGGVVVNNQTRSIIGSFRNFADAAEMAVAMNLVSGRNTH